MWAGVLLLPHGAPPSPPRSSPDLTFLHEGSKTLLDGLVNVEKLVGAPCWGAGGGMWPRDPRGEAREGGEPTEGAGEVVVGCPWWWVCPRVCSRVPGGGGGKWSLGSWAGSCGAGD